MLTSTGKLSSLFLLLILMTQVSPRILDDVPSHLVKATNGMAGYTSYVYATEWAPAACLFSKCNYWPVDDILSIHGLWPSSGSESPFECEPFRYDESHLDPAFKKELYSRWAGLWKPYWDFIKYELKKHGSCWLKDLHKAGSTDPKIIEIIDSLDPLTPFGKYNVFLKISVYLNKKMDTFGLLRDNGVVPSDSQTYPLDTILKIINSTYKLTNGLIPVCKKDKIRGVSVIVEFRYCLDLNYNPIDCDPIVVRRNIQQCGKNPVGYPTKQRFLDSLSAPTVDNI